MKRLSLFIILLLASFYLWCQQQNTVGKIKIGVNLHAPPFGFGEDERNYEGVDINLARSLGRELNRKVVFVPIAAAQDRESMLSSKEVDFIIAVYSITPERKRSVSFSQPYFTTDTALAILVKRNSVIKNYTDLAKYDYEVVESSTSDSYDEKVFRQLLFNITKKHSETGTKVRDQKRQMDDFTSGKVQAIIDDRELVRYWCWQYPDKYRMVALPNPGTDSCAIGVSPGNTEYLAAANRVVKMYKDSVQGWIHQINSRKQASSSTKSTVAIIVIVLSLLPLFLFALPTAREPAEGQRDQTSEQRHDQNPLTRGTSFAWMIVNSDYRHQNDLYGHPFDDADRIREILHQYGYSRDDIFVHKNATREEIIEGFTELAKKDKKEVVPFADRITAKDNLLIYYSGHGYFTKTEKNQIGYWIPVDADDRVASYIRDSEIKAFVNEADLHQILLVSDSCFAGKLLNGFKDIGSAERLNYFMNPCIEIITSGNNRVPAESQFARVFVDILKNNTKPYITTDEIALKMRDVLRDVDYYYPQYGSFSRDNLDGKFIFQKKSIAREVKKTVANQKLTETEMGSGSSMATESDEEKKILNLFQANNARFLDYYYIKSALNLREDALDMLIDGLIKDGCLIAYENNKLFITAKGKNRYNG